MLRILSPRAVSFFLLMLGTSTASPLVKRTPDFSVEFLGNVTSTNTEDIRDLGFAGCVGRTCLGSYGDTLVCGDGSAEDRYYQTQPCVLLHANSAAYATDIPLSITDFNLDADGNAQMFCGYLPGEIAPGETEAQYGMGITNVIAIPGSDTQGVLYFLKNHRPDTVHDDIVGAGIAIVDVSGPYPTCQRTSEYWWDSHQEPNWGDHTSVLAPDGYVYVFGGANTTLFYDGIYVARVPHASQQDMSQYEYWNGSAYTPNRVYSPSEQEAVLYTGSTGQGQITWNSYLQQYLYLYTSYAYIVGKTAPNPEGPWSDQFTLFDVQGGYPFVYSPTQQTQYDASGRTVVVGYTAYPNILQAIKISFE
ncbi:hypothetical protein NKR23_g10465 [Pleurostoma richardsiae]|uniref:DUF4185 domain-containing protein n=1 Tax=Pleurostoma richardsiae TaxID=41990 RepID=A0AA38VE69_9PEZI|nr:hypothetical protein NKR23_g10465 [Pleurostoma richardsiae]